MKLSLEAGRIEPGLALPLEVQSISPSGLVVLKSYRAPSGIDEHFLGDPARESEPLTFVLEMDGRHLTLQANLVWLEVSNAADERQIELIVDTGDSPGWWEVHAALTKE
jgi:hypothetical protein